MSLLTRIAISNAIGQNTGKFLDFLNPDLMVMDILVPEGTFFPFVPSTSPPETLGTAVKAWLKTYITNDTALTRLRMVGPYESFEDRSEKATVQTLGYGKEIETNRGVYKWYHTYDEGGLEYHQKVRTYKGKVGRYRIFRIDAKGNVYGTYHYATTTGLVDGIQGFKLSRFDPIDWEPGNKQTEAVYGVALSLANAAEWNENLEVIATGEDLRPYLSGLQVQDVTLHVYASMAASKGVAMMYLGGVNMAATVPGICVPASFIATNKTAGGTIAITSVTIVDGKVEILLDSVDPNYGVGDTVGITLASVSTLAAAGFRYYESNEITFTMD